MASHGACQAAGKACMALISLLLGRKRVSVQVRTARAGGLGGRLGERREVATGTGEASDGRIGAAADEMESSLRARAHGRLSAKNCARPAGCSADTKHGRLGARCVVHTCTAGWLHLINTRPARYPGPRTAGWLRAHGRLTDLPPTG